MTKPHPSDSTRSERRRQAKRQSLNEWQRVSFDMLHDLRRAIERCQSYGSEYQSYFANLLEEKRILTFLTSKPMTMDEAVLFVITDGAWTISDISHEVKLDSSVIHSILDTLKQSGKIIQSNGFYQPKD